MFRNRPRLALDLLRTVFGMHVPDDAQVSLGSETYTDMKPTEYRCDVTAMVGDPAAPSMAVVVEAQRRYDKDKTYSWPVYLTSLRSRHRCPVTLLVYCPDEATARACAAPISIGHPGWVLRPLTFCPERLPPITDPEQARRMPELTVLGAPAHADGPDAEAVIRCLDAALDTVDYDIGLLYHDYAASRLSDAARKLLEEIVKVENYEWASEFARRHIAEGKALGRAQGEAKLLLVVLAGRGIDVPDEARDRITSCTDTAQLEHWARRASTASTIEEVFG